MKKSEKPVIGWREWIALPELGIQKIKAKIDTGAKTSSLHAFKVETYRDKGVLRVRFLVHPLQNNEQDVVECSAEVLDRRVVRDSGGHEEKRYVISSQVVLGKESWPAQFTLTNRDTMAFRLLLGREALENRFVVDPAQSFLRSISFD